MEQSRGLSVGLGDGRARFLVLAFPLTHLGKLLNICVQQHQYNGDNNVYAQVYKCFL